MKKSILAIFAFFFCTSTFASHLQGGEIYWECTNNGKYIFTLALYRDCNGIPLSTLSETINSNTTNGSITCTFVSKMDVTQSCYDPSQSISCNGAQGSMPYVHGAIEKYTYKSNAITLTGTPPVSGWSFSWSSCCRPPSVQNSNTAGYYLESKMYVNTTAGCEYSSPIFLELPGGLNQGKGTFSSLAITLPISDSVTHSFAAPKSGVNSFVTYNAGFSTSAPFPDASEDPTNGPTVMDATTGLITYEVNGFGTSSSLGTFIYAVKAKSWKNGVLYSEVVRDVVAVSDYFSPSNNVPSLMIDSATSSHTLNKLSRGVVEINCSIGDSVEFDILGSDFDFNSNGFPQDIIFSVTGSYLDTIWGSGSQSNPILLAPISPQTGFVSGIQNSIRFKWQVPPSGITGEQQFVFNFKMQDDACPYPGQSSLSVILNSVNPISINMDSAHICDLDTIASIVGHSASGNYLWSPSNNISNTTIASPLFYPNASQYYYLIDPNSPGIIDSIYIEVEQSAQLSLAYVGAILTPSANTSLDSHQWYFNGVPFLHPFSALSPFGSGLYYVEGAHGPCNETSNITAVAAGSFKTVITPTNGSLNVPIQLIGSLGVDFYLTDPQHVELKGINLIGLNNGKPKQAALGDNLNVKLYEKATQTELWSTDVSVTQQGDLLHIPLSFNQFVLGTEYTLAVTGDTSLYFMAYQGVAFPYEPDNNGLLVIGANEGIAQQYPSVPTDKVLPLSLEFLNSIDLNEDKTLDISIFPNPIKDQLVFSDLRDDLNYDFEIIDAAGRQIYQLKVDSEKEVTINTSDWPSGVYFIRDKNQLDANLKKIIKE